MKHSLLLLLAAVVLPAAPPGWTEHRDPKGFSVQHPPGWVVETPEKDMVVIHDPTGGIQAIAYGFMTRADLTARQWIEGMPTRFPARFQKVALDGVSQNRPTQAVADMRYTSRWGDGRARVLCSLNRGAGMMFAIATPAFRFDEFARDLIAILQSFTVTQPQGGAPQQAGQQQQRPPDPLTGIDWTRWSDPVENAISLEVPRGWRMEGGTVRRGPADVHQWIRTTSQDGIMIFSGDRDQTSYVLPTQTMALGGWREGSMYSPGYGTQMMVMRYIPGVAFAEQFARQHLGAAQIRERKNRDDLAAPVNASNRNVGAGVVQNNTTIGEVSFTTANGSAGFIIAGTQVSASAEMGGMWFVTLLLGYVAPPPRISTAMAVTGHMLNTFRTNPQWFQGQQQTIAQTSQIVSETANAVAKIQSDSYWSRQASQDRSAQNYSDMQRGIQVVVDPNTGQKYEAVAGHNYYYLSPNGTTIAADTELPPNVDVTALNPGVALVRTLGLLAVVTLAIVPTGCGDFLSLHALYTAQDRVLDPAIEGRWESEHNFLQVERDGDFYQAKVQPKNEPAESRDYHVHLVDLGGVRFADVLWTEAIGHMILRVRVVDGQLHLAYFDSKWLRDRVPHEEADVNNLAKQAVWIAPTRQIRSVVAKYAQEPRAYDSDELVYRRR